MPETPDAPRPLPPVDAVERVAGALADLGMQVQPARVFAALLATEDGRLTSADLVELLGISPAAVSGAVRSLLQVRMIRRERTGGSRRDVYVVQDDAWHDVLVQRESIYGPLVAALTAAREEVGDATRAADRLGLSVEFLEFVIRETEEMGRRWDAYVAARSTTDRRRAGGSRR